MLCDLLRRRDFLWVYRHHGQCTQVAFARSISQPRLDFLRCCEAPLDTSGHHRLSGTYPQETPDEGEA